MDEKNLKMFRSDSEFVGVDLAYKKHSHEDDGYYAELLPTVLSDFITRTLSDTLHEFVGNSHYRNCRPMHLVKRGFDAVKESLIQTWFFGKSSRKYN